MESGRKNGPIHVIFNRICRRTTISRSFGELQSIVLNTKALRQTLDRQIGKHAQTVLKDDFE